MSTQNTTPTVANELSRVELLKILYMLNENKELGLGRISKMSTPSMISMFAKHEDDCINIGASMGFGPCLINHEPEPELSVATKPGVVAAIIEFVQQSKGNQFVLGDIHSVLVKKFPDRDPNGLMRTIRTQVPHRLSKERGFEFVRELGVLRCISCK